MASDSDEREARQWLCSHLASLRRRAREGGWEAKLDRVVTAVVAGRSAVAACRSLGSGGLNGSRRSPIGGGIPLSRLGITPVPVHGDYACPMALCDRRGVPDAEGREPRCALYGSVMALQPSDGTTT